MKLSEFPPQPTSKKQKSPAPSNGASSRGGSVKSSARSDTDKSPAPSNGASSRGGSVKSHASQAAAGSPGIGSSNGDTNRKYTMYAQ